MNNYNPNRSLMILSPSEIRFTQDTIAMCFQNDKEVNVTCEEIVKGNIKVSDFPYIRVLYREGYYFSVDNRRLYVFRVLNILGRLNYIEVRKVNNFDREITTQNDGCHITVRNRKIDNRWQRSETYRHCSCFEGKNKSKLPRWWNENQRCHISQTKFSLPSPVENTKRFPTTFPIKPSVNVVSTTNFKPTSQKSSFNQNTDNFAFPSTFFNGTPSERQQSHKITKNDVNRNSNKSQTNSYIAGTKIQQNNFSNIFEDDFQTIHQAASHINQNPSLQSRSYNVTRKSSESNTIIPHDNRLKSSTSRKLSTPKLHPSVVIQPTVVNEYPRASRTTVDSSDVQEAPDNSCCSFTEFFRQRLCCCFFD